MSTEKLHVLAERLLHSRSEILLAFQKGLADPLTTARAMTSAFDQFLKAALRPYAAEQPNFLLVAIGSYGRREITPRSDLDALLLYDSVEPAHLLESLSQAATILWDYGIQARIGSYSIQRSTILCRKEPKVLASLLDFRKVIGCRRLLLSFRAALAGTSEKQILSLANLLRLEDKAKRGKRYHDLFSAEPDLKTAQGCLRDLAAITWFCRLAKIIEIENRGRMFFCEHARRILAEVSNRKGVIERARSTLLLGRFLLNLAGAPRDRFTREAGLALERLQVVPYEPESFWRELAFARTQVHGLLTALLHAIGRKNHKSLAKRAIPSDPIAWFFEWYDNGGRIVLPPALPPADAGPAFPRRSKEVTRRFIRILTRFRPRRALDALHRAAVFQWLLPGFSRTIGLRPGDDVHAFTLDRHLLMVASEVGDLLSGASAVPPQAREALATGKLYRLPLLLAALLHDLGKAASASRTRFLSSPGPHPSASAGIARGIALKVGLCSEEAELVAFLCRNHMVLPHISAFLDTESSEVLQKICETFPKPHLLDLAFLLGLADLRSLGQEVSTVFREDLLFRTWLAARKWLLAQNGLVAWAEEARRKRERLLTMALARESNALFAIAQSVPDRLLNAFDPEHLIEYLSRLEEVVVSGPVLTLKRASLPEVEGQRYLNAIYIGQDEVGLLSRLSGSFTLHGFSIQEARIFTIHPEGVELPPLVIDLFLVKDTAGLVGDSPEACALLAQHVLRSVFEPSLGQRLRGMLGETMRTRSAQLQAEVDNVALPDRTTIRVTGPDADGLLYAISDALFRNGIDVSSAIVTTEGGIARDTFFVRMAGQRGKVTDPDVIRRILRAISEIGNP